jgi:ribosome-associated protein
MQSAETAMKIVEVQPPYIKLEQFLKWAGACQTGGEAKLLIAEGLVAVNRQVCTLRGKKLSGGERVDVRDPDPGIGGTQSFLVAMSGGCGVLGDE